MLLFWRKLTGSSGKSGYSGRYRRHGKWKADGEVSKMRALLSRCFVGSLRALSGPVSAPQNQVVSQVAAGKRLHLLRKSMQYLTEERGQPNSPDYRIYFSKFTTVTLCAHWARTLAFEWGRRDGLRTESSRSSWWTSDLYTTGPTSQTERGRSRCKHAADAGSSFEGIYYFIITTSDSCRGCKTP